MSNETSAKTYVCGLNFCSLLTIVFITLKLINVIDWSWWWVLGPLWIPSATVISIIFIIGVAFALFGWLDKER